jgi:hypothetical protein
MRGQMRGVHDLLRQNPASVHAVGMELNLNILKFNAVYQVDALFGCGCTMAN